MEMSELKQKLLLYELEKIGFRDAQYYPATDRLMVQPNDNRMPLINNAGDIKYGSEHDSLVVNTLQPIVREVNEAVNAWERSSKMPFDELKQFRVLAEYNGIMMAARDDTEYERGLHFVTWQYNYDRTGVDHGHYTESYAAAKEDFAVRSGLVPEAKLFTYEQSAELKASIAYRLDTDDDLTYSKENELQLIAEKLRGAYPGRSVEQHERYSHATRPDKDADSEKLQEAAIHKDTQNETIKTAKTIFGEVQSGDWVIAAGNSDYDYLLGVVTAIDKHGTPEHITENETDDIHVDFTAFDYPQERITEIEKDFSELFDEEKEFDELPIDDVIMAPDELIRITHLGYDEMTNMGNLRENCEAFCRQFISPSQHHGVKFDELVKRVDKNLADYHKILDGFGQGELIEMASRIDVMNEAHHYLTLCYEFSADELDFYLQFENPLEIVADKLTEYRNYSDDLDFSMENLNEHKEMILIDYPLIKKDETTVDKKLYPVEKLPEKAKKAAEKEKPKKTLDEKMKAAKEKVKAQDAQPGDNKSRKRDERN